METLVAAGRRRTRRLVEAVLSLGYALGSEAAARLAARLGMRISGPTVLRCLENRKEAVRQVNEPLQLEAVAAEAGTQRDDRRRAG